MEIKILMRLKQMILYQCVPVVFAGAQIVSHFVDVVTEETEVET